MELHERLVTTKPAAAALPQKEPFADLKNSIHMLVISELGPQLTGQALDDWKHTTKLFVPRHFIESGPR